MVQTVLGQWLMLWFLQELNEALSLCWFLDLADVRRLQVCVCVFLNGLTFPCRRGIIGCFNQENICRLV